LTDEDPFKNAEYVVQKFRLLLETSAADFVLAYLDLLLDFTQNVSKNFDEFCQYWDSQNTFFLSESTTKGVIISTIHKAKGLEYPVVIIPEFDWDYTPTQRDRFWVNLAENGLHYPELETAGYQLNLLPFTYVKGIIDYFKESKSVNDAVVLDNLNKIYVAFTRPTEKLYIWTKATEPSAKAVSSLLFSYFGQNTQQALDRVVFKGQEGPLKSESTAETSIESFMPTEVDFAAKLQIRFTENDEQNSSANIGKAIHSVIEELIHVSDFEIFKQKLLEIDLLEPTLKEKVFGFVHQLISNSPLAICFQTSTEVLLERDILQKNGATYRPDRISIVSKVAYIIDYKTGEKSSTHISQIRKYGELLRQMGFENVKLFIVYFQFLEWVEVQ
jgi:ATP-dependent helicase/nuclease subunit A